MAITEQQSEAIGRATVALYALIERDLLVMIGNEIVGLPGGHAIFEKAWEIINSYLPKISQALLLDSRIITDSTKDDVKGAEQLKTQVLVAQSEQARAAVFDAVMRRLESINQGLAMGAMRLYEDAVWTTRHGHGSTRH